MNSAQVREEMIDPGTGGPRHRSSLQPKGTAPSWRCLSGLLGPITCLLLLSGCFDLSLRLELRKDGGGRLTMTVVTDPMLAGAFREVAPAKGATVREFIRDGRYHRSETIEFRSLASVEVGDQRFVVRTGPSGGSQIAHVIAVRGDPSAGVLLRGRTFRYELVGPEGAVDPRPGRFGGLEIEGVRTGHGAVWEFPLELLASRRLETLVVSFPTSNVHLPATPVLERLVPESGAPGDIVTLHGSHFGPGPGQVLVGSAGATVESWGDGEIRVRIPNVTEGTYDVVVRGRGASESRPLRIVGGLQEDLARVQRRIEARRKALPTKPEYLYGTETISGAIATVWMDVTGVLLGTQDLRARSDEFYIAALDYREMAVLALLRAERSVKGSEPEKAHAYVAEADRYLMLNNLSSQGAIGAYEGNSDAAMRFARGIYGASKASAKYGAGVLLGPWASRTVDGVFLATDFVIDSQALGLDESASRALREAVATILLDEIPLPSLGGRTLSQVLTNATTHTIGSSQLYPILDEVLGAPEFERGFMAVLARSGAHVSREAVKAVTKRISTELAGAL